MKAYEAGGKVYEAIVALLLEEADVPHKWGIKIDNVHVESDFAIFNKQKLKQVILVTHSTSESGTNMKYWRNLEELFQLKAGCPSLLVSSVVFPGKWKPGLKRVLTAVFDGALDLSEMKYTPELELHLANLVEHSHKLSKSEVVHLVRQRIKQDKQLAGVLRAVSKDFRRVILQATPVAGLKDLWLSERHRQTSTSKCHPKSFTLADTSFKSGLILLSFVNQEERQALYANIASGQSLKSELYGRLVSLGVASKKTTIKGCTLIPSGAVAYTIKWLGEPLIERCLAQASSKYGSQLSDYLDILKNTGRAREIIEQVLSPAVSATPTKAVSAIRKLITKHFCCGKRNIGLETCIQICKYKDARFSFDVIMREGGISPGSGPDRFRGVDKMLIGEKLPSNDVVQCLASVLYARLKRARLDEILSAFEQFCSSIAHQTYVTLIKHRTINVLKDLVLLHLQGKGWHVVQEGVKVRSCLSEFSGAPAGVGDPVFTAVIQRKDRRVLLHVISAYAATHKHKECPGKLRVARYSLNAVGGRRVFRPQAPPEAFLILDGPWTKLFGHTGRAEKAFKESGWKGVIDARTILCGDLPHY